MNVLNCPVTGEKIITIGANGVSKRENYAEIWFVLSDGSRMRVAVSQSAKKQLKKSDADEIFYKTKEEWMHGIKGKALQKNIKKEQLKRIEVLEYVAVEDRGGVIIKNQ